MDGVRAKKSGKIVRIDQPSSNSRNSVLQGPTHSRWGAEIPKSTEPYHNRLFEVPYKPPPNELHHLGGLGIRKPRFRSKVHPVTLTQQLSRQTTGNRVNFSLTEDPRFAKKSIPKRKGIVAHVRSYISPVVFADNLESPKSPRSISPTSTEASASTHDQKLNATINRYSSLLTLPEDPLDEFLISKRRTSSQGLADDLKRFDTELHSPRERDVLNFLARIYEPSFKTAEQLGRTTKQNDSAQDSRKQVPKKCNLLLIKKGKTVEGALFGPIPAKKKQTVAAKLSEKYHLPRALVERLAKRNRSQFAQAESNRISMRRHTMKPFPTSDSSGSDDCQENLEPVKNLTLVRTGYCTIPKITVGTRKRKDRLRTNRHLSKQQLNRIRYLFFDERQKWAQKDEIDLGKEPPPFLINRSLGLISKASGSISKSEQSFEHGHQKIALNLKRFLERSRKEKAKASNRQSSLSFEGFKSGLLNVEQPLENPQEKRSESQEIYQRKCSLYGNHQDDLISKGRLSKFNRHPQALFKQSRNKLIFRGIDARDGQYVDPNFMTKQRYPVENTTHESRYVLQSTMRYHTTMRQRLQVNGVDYDEERFGFENQPFLHCLATEWDENYINELKAVKKFKRFRVKTDIIRMRDVMRKNFNNYFILENLANLRHKQRHEESFIENLNAFAGMCDDYLEGTKVKAYNSLILKTNHPLEAKTHLLEQQDKCLKAELEHVTEALLAIEQRWDTIMRLQNYYYALMDTEWRKENDWIHRRVLDGQMEVAIYSVERCRSANIRDKSDPSGFAIIDYITNNIFPNMQQMRRVKPDLATLKKSLNLMQSEVFTYLSQYNKTLSLYESISQIFQEQSQKISNRVKAKRKLIHFRQLRQEFIDERNHVLQYEAHQVTQRPLEHAVNNLQMRRVAAVCEEMYNSVMPLDARPHIEQKLCTTAKFSRMHQHIVGVLHSLDQLPVAVLKFTETRVRQQRRKVLDEGRAAAVKQTRFGLLQRQLRGFFGLLQKNAPKNFNVRSSVTRNTD